MWLGYFRIFIFRFFLVFLAISFQHVQADTVFCLNGKTGLFQFSYLYRRHSAKQRIWKRFCVSEIIIAGSLQNHASIKFSCKGAVQTMGVFQEAYLQPGAGGGYSQKNWVGVCGPLPKTLTLFTTKICDFPYPVYDLTKN